MMRILSGIGLSLAIQACRTIPDGASAVQSNPGQSRSSAEAGENVAVPSFPCGKPTEAPAEGLAFRKVVGALTGEEPQGQIYDCRIKLSDLEDAERFQRMVAEVAQAPLVTAFLLRAVVPSIQICVYQNDQEILLFERASTYVFRAPTDQNTVENTTANELAKIVNQRCAYP